MGVCIGLMLRKCFSQVIKTEMTVNVTVSLLVLLFGQSIGSDRELLSNFSIFGINALVISLLGIIGSMVFSLLFEKLYVIATTHSHALAHSQGMIASDRQTIGTLLFHSLRLPLILLVGVVVGLSGVVSLHTSSVSYVVLCILVFQVGLSLGNRSDFMAIVRSVLLTTLMLPISTILGTLIFTIIASLLLNEDVRDTLLVGISIAGINSMDVCLPMIVRHQSNSQLAPMAIVHGIAIEISVPMIIAALC